MTRSKQNYFLNKIITSVYVFEISVLFIYIQCPSTHRHNALCQATSSFKRCYYPTRPFSWKSFQMDGIPQRAGLDR